MSSPHSGSGSSSLRVGHPEQKLCLNSALAHFCTWVDLSVPHPEKALLKIIASKAQPWDGNWGRPVTLRKAPMDGGTGESSAERGRPRHALSSALGEQGALCSQWEAGLAPGGCRVQEQRWTFRPATWRPPSPFLAPAGPQDPSSALRVPWSFPGHLVAPPEEVSPPSPTLWGFNVRIQ